MVTKFRWDGRLAKFTEILVDMFLVFLGFFTVIGIGSDIDLHLYALNFYEIRDLIISNFTYFVIALIFFRVYDTSVLTRNYLATIISVFFSLVFTNLLLVLILVFIPDLSYSKTTLFFTMFIQFFYISLWKAVLVRYIQKRNIKKVLVFGREDEVEELVKKLLFEFHHLINIKYIFTQTNGNYIEVINYLDSVDQIYISPNVTERAKNRIVNYCLGKRGLDAFLIPKTYEISLINARPVQIKDQLSFQVSSLHISIEGLAIKRIFDFIMSTIGIIVLSPLLILIAVLIKNEDKGPVFFRQKRVTSDNRCFNIFKFRTMIVNAEKETGAVQASEDDPRITKIGRYLRATRLDELPQLFNVFRGEMSLVGPRALRTEEVEEFEESNQYFKFRSHVKAGMTGLAQTQGNYATSPEDKLRLDLMYIRNFSFFNDIAIILHTLKVIFDRESARGIRHKDMELGEFLDSFGYEITDTKAEHAMKLKKVRHSTYFSTIFNQK